MLESLESHAGLHKVQILTGHPGTLKYTLFHLLLVNCILNILSEIIEATAKRQKLSLQGQEFISANKSTNHK